MTKRSELDKDIEVLREDVAKLRRDLASTSKKIVEIGKDQSASIATEARAKLQSEAMHLIGELNSVLNSTRGKGKRAVNSIENKVTEKPLMSVAIALIAGLIFGKLADRS